MNKAISILLAFAMVVSLAGCTEQKEETGNDGVQIVLSDEGVTVDGAPVTGEETAAVYTANDIVFYLAGQGFTYGEGSEADEHTQAEADAHTVVHITQPGTYRLSGRLSAGQIAVDLGENAKEDTSAVVTLILDGADITCTVAPAIIFYRVYECGSADTETASETVDTSRAGANVVLADGSENTLNGSYVARIYKSYTLSEDGTEVVDNKKLHKYDGALYSRMSMNVGAEKDGSGVLNINAENEGLDSELHLTVNGGNINIVSGNDGINTNEDGVSVTTINGGTLNIRVSGTTGEGDGIDSNGWLVINGGTVISSACADSGDAGIDSDCGIYLNGGTVIAGGNMLDAIAGGSQNYAVFRFAEKQPGGETYTLKNADGEEVISLPAVNAFQYLIVSSPELSEGEYTLWNGDKQLVHGGAGSMDGRGAGGGMPRDFDGERPELRSGELPPEPPEDGELPGQPERERPMLPDGERPEAPDGERPELPRNGSFPGGADGAEEKSEIFTLAAGGNLFANVAQKE